MAAPLAISMGDPAGIGPEIAIRAAHACAHPCVLVGDDRWLAQVARSLDLPVPDIQPIAGRVGPFEPGKPGATTGQAAYQSVVDAVQLVQQGQARALVTAPLAKFALQQAGHSWPGHTELLAHLAGDVPVRMMLANPELRVVLVTVHMALREALDTLSTTLIEQTIRITAASLDRFGISAPRIAVAGVNPHAGEGGLFGNEEATLIEPAISSCRDDGIEVSGPFAPDTIFMRARGLAEFDAVIAMYHDQGLIPVKYLGIEQGVNVTLGLPFVRTSPDHGTAFDIAGTGRADAASMIAAIEMAAALTTAQE